MSSPDRIFSGRKSRLPGQWTGGLAVAGQPGLPALDPRAQAELEARERADAQRLAEALRVAEERGYAAGRERGEAELASAIAAAGALASSLEAAIPRDVDMVARTVAELALVIARRVVGAELRHEPAVLIAAIEAGLRQAVGASSVQVELHPDAVAPVEAAWLGRRGARHRGLMWSFVGDPTLAPGGCRLRTEYGVVSAGLEDQLAEVAAALDASIPGYVSSALGAGEDRSSAARTADLATLASAPAEAVRAPGRGGAAGEHTLPIVPGEEAIAAPFGLLGMEAAS